MRISKMVVIFSLGAIILSIIVIFYFGKGKRKNPEKNNPKYKEVKIERTAFRDIVTANGIVLPINRIELKSKASGQIEELPVEEGDFVRKGDLIARLDQKDERAAEAQAQADLDIAKAELKQAEVEYSRGEQLFQQNLISQEERDQIELNLAIAKGKFVQATTILDRAKERLSESIVKAPIDGIILQKYVEKGQIIASGVSNVGGGTPIADIADMHKVHIEAGIDEIDIGKIQVGQTANVTPEAYPNLTFNGMVVRIAPEAKIEQNVTLFDVIIEIENAEGKLKSGMNATIEIAIVKKENILIAPATALKTPEESKSDIRIALLKKGNTFIPQKVKIGLNNFKQVEILSGLEEGDILGIPMTSRLKAENERLEDRIRSSRSFGSSNSGTQR
jgi:HlyD family secretion protein